jgi:hypothetical protein
MAVAIIVDAYRYHAVVLDLTTVLMDLAAALSLLFVELVPSAR